VINECVSCDFCGCFLMIIYNRNVQGCMNKGYTCLIENGFNLTELIHDHCLQVSYYDNCDDVNGIVLG